MLDESLRPTDVSDRTQVGGNGESCARWQKYYSQQMNKFASFAILLAASLTSGFLLFYSATSAFNLPNAARIT